MRKKPNDGKGIKKETENMENMCLKCLENSYGCTTADHLTNRLEIHRLQTNIVGQLKFPDSQSPGQIFVPKMGYLRTWSHLWFWHGEEQISSVLEWLDSTSCSNVAMLMGELTQDSLRGCLQIKHLIIRHPESNRTLFFWGGGVVTWARAKMMLLTSDFMGPKRCSPTGPVLYKN